MPSLLPTAAVSRPPARLSQAVQLHSLASSARRQGRLAVATVLRVRRSTAGVIQANGAITSDGAVTGATLAGTVSTAAQNSITSASSLATVGTIGTGVWQGTAVASAYLDADTAHLSTTQTFTGDKTFTGTLTVGVDDTGKGRKVLWSIGWCLHGMGRECRPAKDLRSHRPMPLIAGKLLLATAQTAVAANDILGQIDFQAARNRHRCDGHSRCYQSSSARHVQRVGQCH